MYFSEFNGVFFVEGHPTEAVVLESLTSELNGVFSQSQLKSLDDLKSKMRSRVVSRGGNALIDFKYGQRSTFWKGLFGLDNVHWYGSGTIAKIDPARLEKYKRT